MITVDQYEYIRIAHRVYGKGIRQIQRETGHDRKTIRKALKGEAYGYSERESQPLPAIGPYREIIEGWLASDKEVPKKQHHTARRIYHRLVSEHGYTGSEGTIRRHVRKGVGDVRDIWTFEKINWRVTMPRKSRIDAPGALQHIVFRGIERRSIFEDDADRVGFLERLGKVLLQSGTPCYAWALMTNHVHLLLRTGAMPLSTIMSRVLTGHAQQFNRRHRRHGQLFQNRYKSFLCEEDAYLLELVRYIHLNPFRAGIVRDLEALGAYEYCGHGALLGRAEVPWQDREFVLRRFGTIQGEARYRYAAFVAEGKDMGRRPDLSGGGLVRSAGGWAELEKVRSEGTRIKGDERILGSSEFVQQVLKTSGEQMDRKALAASGGLSVETLIERVANHFNIAISDLRSSSKVRRVSFARAILCVFAVRVLGATCVELGRILGLSPSAVSKAVAKGGELEGLEELSGKLLG